MEKYQTDTIEIEGAFHNDPEILISDLNQIKIFTEQYSEVQWQKYVSSKNRHFMLLGNDEWPASIVHDKNYLYNWQNDWNDNHFESFKEKLIELEIPDSTIILFFWMKEHCIETTWKIFVNNWINFLYEDEGCILVNLLNKKTIIFSNGNSWAGIRKTL